MTAAGLAPHPDRDALARTLQRPAGAAGLISRATGQALLRLEQLVELGEADGDSDPQLRATRAGRREIQRAIRLYRSGGAIESTEHLCWLAVLLADLRVRDDAWARMDPAHRDQHRRLWTDVLRGAALDYVPAPASLLAFTAWQSGNGALASMAIDRALGADPGYSMAHLLAGAVEAALPPSAARMPMTPAAVAASYAGTGPRGRRRWPRARRRAAGGPIQEEAEQVRQGQTPSPPGGPCRGWGSDVASARPGAEPRRVRSRAPSGLARVRPGLEQAPDRRRSRPIPRRSHGQPSRPGARAGGPPGTAALLAAGPEGLPLSSTRTTPGLPAASLRARFGRGPGGRCLARPGSGCRCAAGRWLPGFPAPHMPASAPRR